jgi:hypothetical protein
MTRPARNTLPPRLTVAEARRIVTDPHLAAGTHWVIREQAWRMVKTVWAVRRNRAQVLVLPQDPSNPGDAA